LPKETFFNLPEDKRNLIVEAAIDEFAVYSFDQASINRIVANAGIAKGSFYQYFEDKKDLFLFLMGVIAEEKIAYISPVMLNPAEYDIFTVLHELFLSGAKFASEQPRYAAIANLLVANKQAPIYKELITESRPLSIALFEPLIKQAIDRGEVRPELDVEMLNFVIATMNQALVEYSSEQRNGPVHESVIASVDAYIDILKNGISA
jgi:AcrR family transcriptional regulator